MSNLKLNVEVFDGKIKQICQTFTLSPSHELLIKNTPSPPLAQFSNLRTDEILQSYYLPTGYNPF